MRMQVGYEARGCFVAGDSIGHMPSSHAGTHTSLVLDVMMKRGCRCGSREFLIFTPPLVDEPSEWRCDESYGGQNLQLVLQLDLQEIVYNASSLNA
jgi:hypothetical protein